MNFNYIIVFYPLGLLSFYALLELVSIKRLERKNYWFYVKSINLFAGTLGLLLAGVMGIFWRGTSINITGNGYLALVLSIIFLSLVAALLYFFTRFGPPLVQRLTWAVLSNRFIMIVLSLVLLVGLTLLSTGASSMSVLTTGL